MVSVSKKVEMSKRTVTSEEHLESLLNLEVLVSVANALIGSSQLSKQERAIIEEHRTSIKDGLVEAVTKAIQAASDPLGTAFSAIKSTSERRKKGQTFTPIEAVLGMFQWAEQQGEITRIVDPGAGSGRYVLTGLRRNTSALGVACEMDPLVALLLRANAKALGLENRLSVHVGDYRDLRLDPIEGRTLFIGNPPYVRHHDISLEWKNWYSDQLKQLGHSASRLAGLHLHFFVKTLELSRHGDLGCFLTAAEWLDVNYGQSLRDLMTNGLGGKAVFVVEPAVQIFGDALVSACITCFEPGSQNEEIEFKVIQTQEQLRDLSGGHYADKTQAKVERSWSVLLRNREVVRNEDFISLGDLFKVTRGQVTGKNSVWVTADNRFGLPDNFLVPAITNAVDIINATNARIDNAASLRRVIDLPASFDELSDNDRRAVMDFLDWARANDADKGYIATHRKPWWRVNMDAKPQIVVTYMGRRPPVFAINTVGASLINVAHGLYPKTEIDEHSLQNLVTWLNTNISRDSGRVYAGGLTKFEPSEIMRLQIPAVEMFA
jgi:hypothetical protein